MMKLFGIIALAVIMASVFAACKDEPEDEPPPEIPALFQNQKYVHDSGGSFETFKDKVIVTDAGGETRQYVLERIEIAGTKTTLFFKTSGSETAVIMYETATGEITSAQFSFLGAGSGYGWKKAGTEPNVPDNPVEPVKKYKAIPLAIKGVSFLHKSGDVITFQDEGIVYKPANGAEKEYKCLYSEKIEEDDYYNVYTKYIFETENKENNYLIEKHSRGTSEDEIISDVKFLYFGAPVVIEVKLETNIRIDSWIWKNKSENFALPFAYQNRTAYGYNIPIGKLEGITLTTGYNTIRYHKDAGIVLCEYVGGTDVSYRNIPANNSIPYTFEGKLYRVVKVQDDMDSVEMESMESGDYIHEDNIRYYLYFRETAGNTMFAKVIMFLYYPSFDKYWYEPAHTYGDDFKNEVLFQLTPVPYDYAVRNEQFEYDDTIIAQYPRAHICSLYVRNP